MRASVVVIVVLILAHAAGIVLWHHLDTRPPLQDEAQQLRAALRCGRGLADSGWRSFLDTSLHEPRPPLLSLCALPGHILGRTGRASMAMVNLLFIALTLIAISRIGARLYSGKVGTTAAILWAAFPGVGGLSRSYLPEIACGALAALAVGAALESNSFSRLAWSLLCGIACGLGMLASRRFLLFAAPPLLSIALSAPPTLFSPARRTRTILCAAAAAVFIAGPWYCCHASAAVQWCASMPAHCSRASLLGFLSWAGLSSPLRACAGCLLLLPMTVFVGCGTARLIVTRKAAAPLLWWLIGSSILCIPIARRSPCALAPVLPAASLLLAAGLCSLRRVRLRRALFACAWIMSLFNAAILTLPLPQGPVRLFHSRAPRLTRRAAAALRRAHLLREEIPACGIGAPRREDWQLESLLADLHTLTGDGHGRVLTLGWYIAPHPRFNRAALLYYVALRNYPVDCVRPEMAEFIITRFTAPGQREAFEAWHQPWLHLEALKRYPLPDGSEATLQGASLTRRRRYRACDLPQETGERHSADEGAANGHARFADRDRSAPGALVMGPGHDLDAGSYRMAVRLKYLRCDPAKPLARVMVTEQDNHAPRAARDIMVSDIGPPGQYATVMLDFIMPSRAPLDLRIIHTGSADLWIDTITIAPLAAG
ncbi:MAG: glycosyltransferase family 39 protein [Candidatus Aureabacteria bacterium]|nr:glycosyltransferase family 39 protein [Candidatus Auribacterota bacterium]